MQILGIDLGFGFTKATDGQRSLVVKSVIGEAVDDRLADAGPRVAGRRRGAGGPVAHRPARTVAARWAGGAAIIMAWRGSSKTMGLEPFGAVT